jgi:hypothetical protein
MAKGASAKAKKNDRGTKESHKTKKCSQKIAGKEISA